MFPTYGIISCSQDNEYGHPHAEVLNNLRSMEVKLFRTDEQGSIIAYSDGKEITWNCSPTDSWKAGEGTIPGNITVPVKKDNSIVNTTPAEPKTEENKAPEPSMQAPIVEEAPQEVPVPSAYTVIGNINSKAFHWETCSRLPKEKNRVYFGSRDEVLAAGYDNPCDYCTP